MRSVIVTGGSRGLGLGISTRLAASGYRVIAIARSETDELRAAAAAAGKAGRGALHFRAFDLAETRGIAALVAGLHKEFRPLYGLVNNAGIGTSGVLAIMPDEQIERLLQINVQAPLVLSKYVVRRMMSERSGRIVNISSIVASTGYHGLSGYSATKAALLGFTRSLAREVGQLGITVNAVAPGFVETRMTEATARRMGVDWEEFKKGAAERTPVRRVGQPADIAHAIAFFCSEESGFVSGQTLYVRGGP